MNLTTLENAKLYITENTASPLLTKLIAWVSANVESYIDREVETIARTEYFDVDPGQRMVIVRAYPITSVASVYNDPAREYTTTSITSSDYAAYPDGRIAFDYALSYGIRALKVTYTGGMAADVAALETAYPDLVEAVTLQVVHEWRRRNSLSEDTAALAQGAITVGGSMRWLPHVKDILDGYRRAYVR